MKFDRDDGTDGYPYPHREPAISERGRRGLQLALFIAALLVIGYGGGFAP